jgi:hypothetical protein
MKKKMDRQKVWGIILIIIGIGIVSTWILLDFGTESTTIISTEKTTFNPFDVNRSVYHLPERVFSDLPALPNDTGVIRQTMSQKNIGTLNIIGPEYYLQPEFYPTFTEQGLSFLTNPNTDVWRSFGINIFPTMTLVELSPGETKTIRFFIHSAWGVRNYQGIKLGEITYNAPSQKLSVTPLPKSSFLVGPNYPFFDSGWVQAVDVLIKADPQLPEGQYQITIPVTNATDDFSQEMKRIFQEKYTIPPFESLPAPHLVVVQASK